MPKRQPGNRGRWEYRDHWIDDNVTASDNFYAYWYKDTAARRKGSQSRKSLGTSDLEEAKDFLVQFILKKHTSAGDALILSVLSQYVDEVADKLAQPKGPPQALKHFKYALEAADKSHARISELTPEFQRDVLMARWRTDFGHAAGTISRTLSVLKSAITHCGIEAAPQIHHPERMVCKLLRIKPNNKEKWIPTDDELARFLDGISSELAFRWTMICLNTACRPEAGIDLGPAAINLDNKTVDLNPRGRQQEPTKWRPVLRLTENLAGWAGEWDPRVQVPKTEAKRVILAREKPWKLEPRFAPYSETGGLTSTYHRVRALKDKQGETLIDMPGMVPYSIRNKMVTVLRARQVPGSQRSMWLGHMDEEERQITSRSYGAYDPTFLKDAADATDDYLFELNKRTDRDLFAQSHCKSTANQNIIDFVDAYKSQIMK